MKITPFHVLALSSLFAPAAHAALTLTDGAAHIIDETINDYIEVFDGPSGPTSVTFNSNTVVVLKEASSDDSVSLNGSSIGVVNDGAIIIDDFATFDSATLSVTGGQFNDDLQIGGASHLLMTGGLVGDQLEIRDTATAIISSGTIQGDLFIETDAMATLFGGTFAEDVQVDGFLSIRGGIFSQIGIEFGLASAGGKINISGSHFQLNGVSIGLGNLPTEQGTLTGILESGESFSVLVDENPLGETDPTLFGTITLVPSHHTPRRTRSLRPHSPPSLERSSFS